LALTTRRRTGTAQKDTVWVVIVWRRRHGLPRRRGPSAIPPSGRPVAGRAGSGHRPPVEKLTLQRGPAGSACLGTKCRQSRWLRPPTTISSPAPGCRQTLLAPPAGRMRKRRGGPETQHWHDAPLSHAADQVAAPACRVPVVSIQVDPKRTVNDAVVHPDPVSDHLTACDHSP
jgi:hypothetical protein